MRRNLALVWFLLRELVRSLAVMPPLALTLGLYWIFFEYPGDVDYFAATGAFTVMVATVVAVLLLASQLNRNATTATLLRLRRRNELLAAVVLCAAVVAGLLAALFTALAVGLAKVAIEPAELLLIAPRWLALAFFAACLGLLLTRLTSRRGSYLAALAALAVVATVVESHHLLARGGLIWLDSAVAAAAWPVSAALRDPVQPASLLAWLAPVVLTMVYGIGLFALAAWLFEHKDLLWTE